MEKEDLKIAFCRQAIKDFIVQFMAENQIECKNEVDVFTAALASELRELSLVYQGKKVTSQFFTLLAEQTGL